MFNPIDAIEACIRRFYDRNRFMPTRLILDQNTLTSLIITLPSVYRDARTVDKDIFYLGLRVETIDVLYIHIEVS